MIIRDFRKEDIEDVIECAKESFIEEFEVEGFDPDFWRRMVRRRYSVFGRILFGVSGLFNREPIRFFVVDVNGRVVGTTMVTRRGKNIGYISTVMVHPDFRRKGLATELMKTAINYIQKRKLARAILRVSSVNNAAKGLYQKLGFREFDAMSYLTTDLGSLPNLQGVEGVQVREFQKSDIDAVYNLIKSSSDPNWFRISDFKKSDLKTPLWNRIAGMAAVKKIVVVKDEKIVGYVSLNYTTAKMACQITRIEVSSDVDAKEIEEELIRTCTNYVRPLGTKTVLVTVPVTRAGLIERLTTLGFEKQFVMEGMVLE